MTNDTSSSAENPPKDPTTTTIRVIGRMTAALVAILAIAAFGLSFEALRDLAVKSAVMNANVAWLFPLIVDGGIVVFSLAALRASLTGADRRWFMSLVVFVTVISVGLNIAHAGSGWLPAVMAAMPPLLLFLAFESLMRQVHDTVLGPEVRQSSPARVRASKPRRQVVLSAVVDDGVAARKARALELLGQGISRNGIARELKMSPATVRRYLAETSKCA